MNHEKLKPGTRVALDMTTLAIMRILPREVDPTVFHVQNTEDEVENGKKISEASSPTSSRSRLSWSRGPSRSHSQSTMNP